MKRKREWVTLRHRSGIWRVTIRACDRKRYPAFWWLEEVDS